MFAAWCASKTGISEDKIPKLASTSKYIEWYNDQSRNRYMRKGKYEPKAGDLVFYQWYHENSKGTGYYDLIEGKYVYNSNKTGKYDLLGHTGVVIACQGNYFYTIEGNSADQVRIKRVPLDAERLKGFGINGGSSNGVVPAHYAVDDGKVS